MKWLRSTWRAAGGKGDPRDASLATEYAIAQHWITRADWRTQWPTCGPRAYRVLGRGPR